jgi:DNA repair protein RecO
MYSITHTKGIVLKTHDLGEKDYFLSLFTEDLGQIYARVSGIRDMKSKHRYSLQEHSLVDVSLVKGKTGWRVTNSSHIKSFYYDIDSEKGKGKRDKILQILSLVKRFYLGEESNPKVFGDLLNGFENILRAENDEELQKREAQTVLDFLQDLGYIEERERGSENREQLKDMRKLINNGIRESGL